MAKPVEDAPSLGFNEKESSVVELASDPPQSTSSVDDPALSRDRAWVLGFVMVFTFFIPVRHA